MTKTNAQIVTDIETNLPNNITKQISPLDVRTILEDMLAREGQANGYPQLGGTGIVPTAQLPPVEPDVSSFDTLTEALAADVSPFSKVTTYGNETLGDAPEAEWLVKSSLPASPNVFRVNIGGRWLQLSDHQTIKTAVICDPTPGVDNTDALQECIDYLRPIELSSFTHTVTGRTCRDGLYGSLIYNSYFDMKGFNVTLSKIFGTTNGWLIRREGTLITDRFTNAADSSTGSKFSLHDCFIKQTSSADGSVSNDLQSGCVEVFNSVAPTAIHGCIFESAFAGVWMVQPFTGFFYNNQLFGTFASLHDPEIDGVTGRWKHEAALGLYLFQCHAFSNDIVGFGTGVRITGASDFMGGRLEVNIKAMDLGGRGYSQGLHGVDLAMTAGSAMHSQLESNLYGVDINYMSQAQAGLWLITGNSAPRPGGAFPNPETGLTIFGGSLTANLLGASISGSFRKWGYHKKSFDGIISGPVTINGIAAAGAIGVNQPMESRAYFGQPIYDKTAALLDVDDTNASRIDRLEQAGLVAVNRSRAPVFSHNLAGTLAVANGATTATYMFMIAKTSGSFQFNASPSAAAGGSAPAGTFYYAATGVCPLGETGVSLAALGINYRSVVLTAGQKAVWTRFGVDARQKFRVYRGTVLGEFDGFFEDANTVTSGVDDFTRAFDGYGYPPPSTAAVPTQVELDANYYIQVQPTWATTWYISAKSTTAFTVTFGTAAPSDQVVGWIMYRP